MYVTQNSKGTKYTEKSKSSYHLFCSSLVLFFFFKILFILFLNRGEEREREGEKHQCVVASHVPP